MTKEERMKEIAKASPDFGKRVGYKMCVVDEFHDIKELQEENAELEKENAELKEKLEIEENARGDWFGKAVTKDRLLTEAKEIIEGLMRFCRCFAQHHTEDIRYKDAEEFLKEVSND